MLSARENMHATAVAAQAKSASPARYVFIDVWRGLAIIGVVAYHFGWDLNFFGLILPDLMFSGPVTVFARALAGSFMFLVGVSLVLAHNSNLHWWKFIKRLVKLITAAVAISIVTYFLFPDAFIYFGILHSIALASVIGLAFLPLPTGLIFFASFAVLAAPFLFETSAFDTRMLAWVGLAAEPPMANDFVPVFPWFGVTLAGIACTRLFLSKQRTRDVPPKPANGVVIRGLAWVGRRTLPIYLFHQPLLIAGLVIFTRFAAT
ncbi:heparan-alpha-glucosaminide N-acetyltransferase [Aurantimonas coralicida]|uniref:heparan-alpha-glucosaminide N-acetyltransferase n=1 Tax=Aurantimonas coralicida TaxID=182270 RepID=UPI000685704C|nr:heparan-alpha-glucosaminide N-acetyltransferase [Aurantimonas coralicida]